MHPPPRPASRWCSPPRRTRPAERRPSRPSLFHLPPRPSCPGVHPSLPRARSRRDAASPPARRSRFRHHRSTRSPPEPTPPHVDPRRARVHRAPRRAARAALPRPSRRCRRRRNPVPPRSAARSPRRALPGRARRYRPGDCRATIAATNARAPIGAADRPNPAAGRRRSTRLSATLQACGRPPPKQLRCGRTRPARAIANRLGPDR